MANQTDTRYYQERDDRRISYPLAAGEVAYNGALFMINPAGFATRAAALASNKDVKGFSVGFVDNSTGADGDQCVELSRDQVEVNCTGATQAWVGSPAFASDDNNVSITDAGDEPSGMEVSSYISATKVEVRFV